MNKLEIITEIEQWLNSPGPTFREGWDDEDHNPMNLDKNEGYYVARDEVRDIIENIKKAELQSKQNKMNISPTYISAFVMLAVFIAGLFKVNINQDGLTQLITEVVGIIASIIVLVRRYRKGDISILGAIKKTEPKV